MLEKMIQISMIFAAAYGVASGVLYGAAAVIQAWYNGKATLIRAERGEPEPPSDRASLPSILRPVLRNRWNGSSNPET